MSIDDERDSRVVSPVELTDRIALFGTPRMWVPLLGIALLVVAALVWGAFAQAPITVPAEGVITTVGGPLSISTSVAGTVKELYVVNGEKVQVGNNIAVIEDDAGNLTRVQSPIEGTVIELSTKLGNFAPVGETLATLQDEAQGLRAISLIPMANVGGLKVGQEVLVSPQSVPSSDYGYLRGTVATIGTVPMSQARIDQLVGGVAGFAGSASQDSPVVEVDVILLADSATPSGFSWTIGAGPPFRLLGSTPWSGDIVLGERSRLSALFG